MKLGITACARALVVASLAVACSGCASWFLNGAEEHVGVPPQYVARFTVPSCTLVTGGSMPGAAGQWYYLAQDERGMVLYELDAAGEGAAIRNHWSDQRADHFFVWVSGSHGWVFSFPSDRATLPVRYVFPAGSYTTSEGPDGVTMPVGQPQAMCQLVPT